MTQATAAKTSTLQLTVNEPIEMEVLYIDVWPNDPSKDLKNHKGFGASVALKGLVAGEEVRVYPKGFANKTIEKLVKFDVIEDGHYEHDPAEHYSIPVKTANVRLGNMLPKGERYVNFDILAVYGPVAPPATLPKAANPKSPPSFANKPEADLPPYLRDQEQEDAAALTAKIEGETPKVPTKKEAYAAAQYESVRIALEVIVPLYEAKKIGMTDDVIHKHAFELFKTWCDKGLVG